MRKKLWKFALFADGILTFFFITQFDVDDMWIQYIGALVGIVTMLFLMAIGWQWVMEYENEDTEIIDIDKRK